MWKFKRKKKKRPSWGKLNKDFSGKRNEPSESSDGSSREFRITMERPIRIKPQKTDSLRSQSNKECVFDQATRPSIFDHRSSNVTDFSYHFYSRIKARLRQSFDEDDDHKQKSKSVDHTDKTTSAITSCWRRFQRCRSPLTIADIEEKGDRRNSYSDDSLDEIYMRLTKRIPTDARKSVAGTQLYDVVNGMDAATKKLMRSMLTIIEEGNQDADQKESILRYFSAMVMPQLLMNQSSTRVKDTFIEPSLSGVHIGSVTRKKSTDAPGCVLPNEADILKAYEPSKNDWNLDLHKLDNVTGGHILIFITKTALEELHIYEDLPIDPETVMKFLSELEANYKPVLYHSRVHAADVTRTVSLLLQTKRMTELTTALERFALIISAAAHDVGHPGVNNQYLINTNHPLAITYNDISVLENLHASTLFRLLQMRGCNILQPLSPEDVNYFRRLSIASILNTDMARHANVIQHFERSIGNYIERKNEMSPSSRETIVTTLLHCADLSSPTRSLPIYREWTNRVMQEMFMQGDEEAKRGLPVSPMCNRNSVVVEAAQTGFIDIFVEPLWHMLCSLLHPEYQWIEPQILSNYKWYAMQLQPTKPL